MVGGLRIAAVPEEYPGGALRRTGQEEVHDVKRHRTLRALMMTLLLAGAVAVTVSGCLLVPVPIGGGHGHHHDRGRW